MPGSECDLISAAALDRASWLTLSDAVTAFERVWRESAPPDPGAFVPVEGAELRLRTLVELLKVDLEFRWIRGERPAVEEYFERWPELGRHKEARRELVLAECVTRQGFGDQVTREEVEQRFSELAAMIDLEAIHRDVSTTGWSAVVAETVISGNETPGSRSGVEEPELVDGTRIGKFVIRGVLGRGGMGIVYRGQDASLERDVALKLPRLGAEADAELLERFRTEVKRAAAVDHPHLCSIYDADVADGRAYLAMELIDGETILERLRREPLPLRDAVSLTCKVARALGRLHAAGIVHRDISATNVMLDASGEPRLMDFGLARLLDDRMESSGQLVCSGTPAYVAPELLNDQDAQPSAGTDVYSLGVLFYQMLTGDLTASTTVTRGLHPLRIKSDIDREVDAICSRATRRDPAGRYATASEFAGALTQYHDRHQSPKQSRRVWFVAAGGIAAASVALLMRGWKNGLSNGVESDAASTTGGFVSEDFWRRIDLAGVAQNEQQELAAEVETIRVRIDGGEHLERVNGPEVIEFRERLLAILRRDRQGRFAVDTARELIRLPWPAYEESPRECRWWNRLPMRDDPTTPSDVGPLNGPNHVHLASSGTVIIAGQVEQGWGHHEFRLWVDDPRGFFIEIILLTAESELRMIDQWHSGQSDSASPGSTGHTIYPVRVVPKPPHNSHRFFLEGPADDESAEFLLHIWQPIADPVVDVFSG